MLHVITSLSKQKPGELREQGYANNGDIIADLQIFPPSVYQLDSGQELQNISKRVLGETDYWTDARNWLTQFTRRSRLQDLLAINGHSFWWARNCLRFTPALFDYGNLFAWINLFLNLQKATSIEAVTIYGSHDLIIYLVEQVFTECRIEILPTKNKYTADQKSPERHIGLLITRLLWTVIGLIYIFLWRPEVGFFGTTNLLRLKQLDGKWTVQDIYLGDVIKAIQKRGWRTVFVEKYGWNASWKGFFARGVFLPNDLLFTFIRPQLFRLGLFSKTKARWQKKWQQALPVIQSSLTYKSIDLNPILLALIKREFLWRAPALEILVRSWLFFLRIWRPKLLYVHCSYGPSALTAVIAAKQLNIPTIEQQHGAVSKNNMAYLIPPNIAEHADSHLCDKMVVWGERMRRLLVSGQVYESHQAVVCGFPRIDSLIVDKPDGELIRARLGIDSKTPIVLYTSNMLAEGFMTPILDGIKTGNSGQKISWIVKLHPKEKSRRSWEAAIAGRNLESEVKVVEGEFDFYALLAACDIHISLASTTLLESAIFGKINLGLDDEQMLDPAGYREANAFLPVTPDRLGVVVQEILEDPEKQQHLLNIQKEFASDWCIHDGKAVERIVQLIESTIRAGDG